MEEPRLYLEHPELLRAETGIVLVGVDHDRPFVVLRETVFHPEGGGQPTDFGTINGVEVTKVEVVGDTIRHFLAAPLEMGHAVAEIDGERRFDFCQQHSAQHLLTALLAGRHGLPTTAFHLGRAYVAIEVDGPVPDSSRLESFEAEVNREIRTDRQVRTRWAKACDLEVLGVRSRGLPAGHRGSVRLVEIEGVDLNTCGGTHVSRLSKLQAIYLIDAEPARGGARIRFVAGGRILRMLRADQERNTRLKALMAAGPDDFAGILEGWIEDRKLTAKRVTMLEGELAVHLGRELTAASEPEISGYLGAGGPAFLRAVAGEVLRRCPEAVAVLTAQDPVSKMVCFLVQAGPSGPADVTRIGARLRDRLGAKGGGKGRLFQGTGGDRKELKNQPAME